MEKNGYTKEQIKQVKVLPGHAVSITASISVRCYLKVCPTTIKKKMTIGNLLVQWARWLQATVLLKTY